MHKYLSLRISECYGRDEYGYLLIDRDFGNAEDCSYVTRYRHYCRDYGALYPVPAVYACIRGCFQFMLRDICFHHGFAVIMTLLTSGVLSWGRQTNSGTLGSFAASQLLRKAFNIYA